MRHVIAAIALWANVANAECCTFAPFGNPDCSVGGEPCIYSCLECAVPKNGYEKIGYDFAQIQSAGYEDSSTFSFSDNHLYTDGKCEKLDDGRLKCKVDCTQKELREAVAYLTARPDYDPRDLKHLEGACAHTKYFSLEK